MANISGPSAPPAPTPPDIPPVQSIGQSKGISAPVGFQGPPPPIDSNVAAIWFIMSTKHGMK